MKLTIFVALTGTATAFAPFVSTVNSLTGLSMSGETTVTEEPSFDNAVFLIAEETHVVPPVMVIN